MRRKLCMILLGLLFIIPAIARDFKYEGLWYTVIDEEEKTCMTKAGEGYRPGNNISGDIVIPAYVSDGLMNKYCVVGIGDYGFCELSGLTSVAIPESVATIGKAAFYKCSGLTSVAIPESVTKIGPSAFYKCSGLTTITIPESVTTIGPYAFAQCSGSH